MVLFFDEPHRSAAKGWPARKSALFLGQSAGARRSARQRLRTGAFCSSANRQAAQGALHVSDNRVGGGFVRRGFPHRVASRFGQPCRRRVCPQGNSRTGCLAKVATRRGASRLGQPCRRRVCPQGNSRTGCPAKGRPARRGASRFGQPCRRWVCPQGIPAQAARRKAGLPTLNCFSPSNRVGGRSVARDFRTGSTAKVAARRGASRFGQPCRRRVCPQGIPAQGHSRPPIPHSAFRIEARRPAIRDRPARPRDTP